jgi:hypothetical protein
MYARSSRWNPPRLSSSAGVSEVYRRSMFISAEGDANSSSIAALVIDRPGSSNSREA